jgi:hypothetical protein
MAPKQQRVVVERADRRRTTNKSKGFVGQTYETLTSPENASVVRSVVVFGVCWDKTCGLLIRSDAHTLNRLLWLSSRAAGASSCCRRESHYYFDIFYARIDNRC